MVDEIQSNLSAIAIPQSTQNSFLNILIGTLISARLVCLYCQQHGFLFLYLKMLALAAINKLIGP